MIIDTNLLLYGARSNMDEHAPAHRWLTGQLDSGSRIGLPWHSLLGFVRLASNRVAFPNAMPLVEAWQRW